MTPTRVTSVSVVEGGPLLIRGPLRLLDESGCELEVRRRTIAICRCGRSQRQPFCDGTHKRGFKPRPVDPEATTSAR
jgi:CDGSH-type Zn-finger protein